MVAPMPSPTYNLALHYSIPGGGAVVHLDLYRLSSPDDVWELGWSEVEGDDHLVLIEWPDRAGPWLPSDYWEIELVPQADPAFREVRIRKVGSPHELPPIDREGNK